MVRQLPTLGILLCIAAAVPVASAAGNLPGDTAPGERPDIDVRIIFVPTVFVDTGTTLDPEVRIGNIGAVGTPFRAWFRILAPDSTRFYLESLDVSGLEPGLETTLVFPAAPVVMDTGNWFARCSVHAALDTNPANDLLDKPFHVGTRFT